MKDSLEEKRKEIFELHKSWLESSAPLMRKAASTPVKTEIKKEESEPEAIHSQRNWKFMAIMIITGILVLLEILFFAYQMKWFE